MSIALRQYQKIYSKYLLTILKEGRIPTFEEVVSRGELERVAPAVHFLRTRTLHGSGLRRDELRNLPHGEHRPQTGGEGKEGVRR